MTSTRALLVREVAVTTGSPALPLAMAVQMVVLLLFLLVWGGGVPTLAGSTVLEQLLAVQWVSLLVVMPWAAVRAHAPGGREGIALLSLLTGVPQKQVVLSRLAAVCVVLVWVGLAGLPFVVLAQQMTAVPLWHVAGSVGALVALATVVTAVASWWTGGTGGPVTAWVGTVVSTAAIVWLAGRVVPTGTPWVLFVLGAAAAAVLVAGPSRRTRKLVAYR